VRTLQLPCSKYGARLGRFAVAVRLPSTSAASRAHGRELRPQRVLLVEDNPGDADLVRAALEGAGTAIRLDHVERLDEAIFLLSSARVDAVLLDLSLPDAHGAEAVERLRASFPECPLVVLTGASNPPDAALRAGAQDYLPKGQLDGRTIERALAYSIERQRHAERASELAAERAARAATEAGAKLLQRMNEELTASALRAQKAKEQEAAARAEAERRADELEALFASMVDSVLVYGEDRRIRAVNRAATELFGLDARGLTLAELVERVGIRSGDGGPLPVDRMPGARALDGAVVRAERMRIRTRSGDRTVLVSASPLRRGESLRGAVVIYRDVTEQDRADAERERLMAELRETDARKNHFLAMLSHELRNPLAPIRNSVYILERAAPGGEQARRAQAVIDRQAHHMTRLVDDLLDVTRISRGKIRLQRERFELNALVRRTAEDQRSVFGKAGVALEVHASEHPMEVNGDPTRIAQVIGNLLQNAAKFTPRGGRATLSVRRSGTGSAAIHVRDDGAGIPPDGLARVFEPFVQGDRTLDRSHGGLGLGLALVKGLVELHGGSVVVCSAGTGHGAEFVVRLPLDRAEPPRFIAVPSPMATAPVRRILVIEDNPDAAASLRDVLELNDHLVEVVATGPEGIEKAREFRPDVVLCDIGLPTMDGYEVARLMRSDPSLRSIHLVALSGYASPDDVERAMEAGFDRHLAKPPSLPDLERTLGEVAASAPSTSRLALH
jgi:two-component system CheB/CheR fusion protein